MSVPKFNISQITALQLFQVLRFSTLMLIGVVFAKSGLSTVEIGQYETLLLVAGAFSFFWLNGIIQGFLPDGEVQIKDKHTSKLFNIFYLLSIFSMLAALLTGILFQFDEGLFLSNSSVSYFWFLITYILISTPASLVEYIYLLRRQAKMISIYGIVSFLLQFALVTIPAFAGMDIIFCLYGLIASAVFRLVWLMVLLFRISNPKFDWTFIVAHLNLSAPLIGSLLLSGSAQYIDSFIVTSHFDEATFAVFRYGAREFPLVLLLANAFSMAMLSGFNNRSRLSLNLEKIRKNAEKFGNYLFPVSAILMLASHWFFPLVFSEVFKPSASIFNVYLLLIISRLLFPQTILTGLQKNRLILWASFLEVLVNVTLSLYFVQIFGLVGVAYGTVAAYLFEKFLLMYFVSKSCGIPVSAYLNVTRHLIYSLLLLVLFVVIEYII